jgi:2-keto-4-pentenoate hydratase/2-oxohepta-3-ene-1,7-dioic acid hydratase in catechol pathway
VRIATCHHQGHERLGVVTDAGITLLSSDQGWPTSMLMLIDAGPAEWARLARAVPQLEGAALPLSAVTLLAPIPRPRKNIMCLGWNYAEHAHESAATRGQEASLPEHPVVFTKNVTSVNGPEGDIPAQASVTTQLDWEVELGVVVGVGGRSITAARALNHVFGYTVVNDVSARDVQFRHKQYFLGKSLDGACPMGPVIVTADELRDPQALDLRSWVNGALKQSSNTRHQIFDVATTLAILSRGMALEPGDIIATGTPSGVGFARTPPEFLATGDVVECEVAGIGRLRNRVV